ncbi:MAG: Molybdenum transport system permease protein ModB [Pseudomonadota bacterium]|jgi:molybdate transport system permease protein
MTFDEGLQRHAMAAIERFGYDTGNWSLAHMIDLNELWSPIWLTIQLAAVTTVLLLLLGTPIAWWLARSRAPWKEIVATVVAMPIILPPTVLGFYLLLALGPSGPGGWFAGLYGARTLAFTFEGLVIGSIIYSMPFVVQPIRNAFEAAGERPLEVAATLRASPWDTFWTVALPLARPGLLTGSILGFAHTVGEFGVILMIGGSIPGETKVLSIALFDFVETQQWAQAHVLAGGMLVFSFLVIFAMTAITKRYGRAGG